MGDTYTTATSGRRPPTRPARFEALRLDQPFPWDGVPPIPPAIAEGLATVQGNILRPHARRGALHVFVRFADPRAAREWMCRLASQLTTAVAELGADRRERRPLFRSLALSAAGYVAAGFDRAQMPGIDGDAFRDGMARRGGRLYDPPLRAWEPRFRRDIHALLVLADDDLEIAMAEFRRMFGTKVLPGVEVVGVEIGRQVTNEFGESIEHFGYVDGRSQPRFIAGDVVQDEQRNRFREWSSAFPPSQVLVRCPGSGGRSFGSYLVFRKLEQNLRAFRAAEIRSSRRLALPPGRREEAGARLVGRYEDGRPFGLAGRLPSPIPVENGFRYGGQPSACPIGSHVRNVNPRTNSTRGQMIARRGMPYGDGPGSYPLSRHAPEALPTGGLGLLFMAFMADIGSQFEAIQRRANEGAGGSPDALIGQPAPALRDEAYRATDARYDTQGDSPVRLLGGEYFFVPSLDLFRRADSWSSATEPRRRAVGAADPYRI